MKAKRVVAAVGVGVCAAIACSVPQDEARPGLGRPVAVGPAPTTPTRTLGSPRVIDWSSQRYAGRATYAMSPEDAAKATAMKPFAAPLANWKITTGVGGPVTSPMAVVGGAWNEGATPSAYDMLFFATNGTANSGITGGGSATTGTGKNFFFLYNLYTATPTVGSSFSLASGVDRTGIAVSLDGTKVFVLESGGSLRCYATGWTGTAAPAAGATCVGWSVYKNTNCTAGLNGTTAGAVGSSPWVDYSSATQDIYFGDTCGYVNHVNGSSGAKVWSKLLGASGQQAAFESSPVILNGDLFIGDDMGQVFEVTGATSSSAPTAANIHAFSTCSVVGDSAPCPGFSSSTASTWAVRSPIAYDVNANNAYAATNDYVFELSATGTWGNTASSPVQLRSGGSGPMLAELTIDASYPYIYTAFNNKVFKLGYPFSATPVVYSTALQNSGTTTEPSSPLPYNGYTYIGDSSGYMERFDCNGQAEAEKLDGVTSSDTPWGGAITTDMTLDYQTGNVLFGFSSLSGTTPTGPGGVVQFPQTTPLGSSTSAYVCPAGWGLCTGSCIGGVGDSCMNTVTDPNNCGGCGIVCSASHIPVPVCASGVCAGQCADGWVDCDSNRQSNGCESAATCGSCCAGRTDGNPSVCATGTTCYDTGGIGTCVGGQPIMAAATANENGTVTLTCPESSSQVIASLTFADYGTPGGVPAESNTTWNPLACGSNTSQATCAAQPGCAWNASSSICAASCSTITTSAACTGACAWSSTLSACEPAACSSYTAAGPVAGKAACNAAAGCTWNTTTSTCQTYSCQNLASQAACTLPGCSWDSATGTCTTTTCEALNAYSATPGINTSDDCDQTPGCSWNAVTATCQDSCATLTNACASQTGCSWEGAVAGKGYVNACVASAGTTCASIAAPANQCATQTACTWNGASCSCASVPQSLCNATYAAGCTWNFLNGCTGTCTVGGTAATDSCDSNASCVWQGGWLADPSLGNASGLVACNAKACAGLSDACDANPLCTWSGGACVNKVSGGCATKTNACGSTPGCAFDTGASRCTASTGFLHDYGSSSSSVSPSTFTPECALDVSGNAMFTACVGKNDCTVDAGDDIFGTGPVTPNGSPLPLAITPGPIGNYPRNPCPTYAKRLYLEAACGTCP